jgi:hypothetical protein
MKILYKIWKEPKKTKNYPNGFFWYQVHKVFLIWWNMVMEGLLCQLFKVHYQAQGYAEVVVLMQKISS